MPRFILKSEARFGYWTPSTSTDPSLNPFWTWGTKRDHREITAYDKLDAINEAHRDYPELCMKTRTLDNGDIVPNKWWLEELD